MVLHLHRILCLLGFSSARYVLLFSVVFSTLQGSFTPREQACRTTNLSSLQSVSIDQQARPRAPSLMTSPGWFLNLPTPLAFTHSLLPSSGRTVTLASPKVTKRLRLPVCLGSFTRCRSACTRTLSTERRFSAELVACTLEIEGAGDASIRTLFIEHLTMSYSAALEGIVNTGNITWRIFSSSSTLASFK